MLTCDFNFELPPDLIAQEPLPERSQSRMMVVHCAERRIEHRHVTDLPGYLRPGDLLVVNDTRVIPARVRGRWADTGGHMELLLVEEVDPGVWTCMCRNTRRARVGRIFHSEAGSLHGEVVRAAEEGRVVVRLFGDRPLEALLEESGEPPVPPYIQRKDQAAALVRMDRTRYQTVFAREPGAVAAPTAGLHFTPELLQQIAALGIRRAQVTLHVGPGTFKPVKTERVEDHVMEAERYEIGEVAAEAIRATRGAGGRVVAVGSTSVRTLETVAAERGHVLACRGRSSLFIRPPYRFQVVDVMLTNFHLPCSTLLMMVSALAGFRMGAGDDIRAGTDWILSSYREAVALRYRFYSYGDCMLLV
jgi:S-adenosylmethionine:tRNA ribosyltransferase-isomerase